MLLTKIARQFQSIASAIAAIRYGATRSGRVFVPREIPKVQSAKPWLDRSSILSFSLFVTMTAIFAGVFLISFGRLEIPRENPQRASDEPLILRAAPARNAWSPERISSGDFTIAMGSFQAAGRVIDGDTLAAGSKRIRLQGIDALEIGQNCQLGANRVDCGRRAAEFLKSFLSGHHVTCKSDDADRYKRHLATCFLRNGTDVNRHIVASGWAVAYRRYSHVYEQDEANARTRRLGIWAGSFVSPEERRAGAR